MRFEDIPHNLLVRAKTNSPGEMEELCLMVQPGAYAVLLSILRNHEDALDALQESLVRVVRFLPGLRDVNAFPGWLMRMLINEASGMHRKRSAAVVDVNSLDSHSANEAIAPTSTAPLSPRHAAENTEMHELINRALQKISVRQRTAIVLFEMEQMSIRQVAELMEVTDGAVKFHLHEARKNLKLHLQEMGVGNSILFERSEA